MAQTAFLASMLGGWTTARTLMSSPPTKPPDLTNALGRRRQPDVSGFDPKSRPSYDAGIGNGNYQGM